MNSYLTNYTDAMLQLRLKREKESATKHKELLKLSQNAFDDVENEILSREYIKNKDCEHDWSDYGICKKCDAKSMIHNKKAHTVMYPYD